MTVELSSDIIVELIDHMGTDATIARSARVSTGKDLESTEAPRGLLKYLISQHHTSTLEHNVVTFRVEVPIAIAREWMRHRTQSYNELSGRYAEMPAINYSPAYDRPLKNAGTSARPELVVHERQAELYPEMIERRTRVWGELRKQYEWELEQGIAKEVARDNILVSQYTAFYATANLNNWFKFLFLRDGEFGAPQYEIIKGAQQVKKILEDLYPVTMEVYKESLAEKKVD